MNQVLNAGVRGFSDVDACHAHNYVAYLDAVRAHKPQQAQSELYRLQGIGPGASVLEVGCGIGDDVRAISALVGDDGRVDGVDSSQAMIAEAQRRGVPANASVCVASVYSLPFAENTFEVARAERVLQHLHHPDEAAAELYRVLKPGGSVLLVDQDWDTVAIAGADPAITRRIVHAFADSLANGRAGRNHKAVLTRAQFCDVRVVPGVAVLPLSLAYAFVLESAVEAAKSAGAITAHEADAWLASLVEANQRGEFHYSVGVFVSLAVR